MGSEQSIGSSQDRQTFPGAERSGPTLPWGLGQYQLPQIWAWPHTPCAACTATGPDLSSKTRQELNQSPACFQLRSLRVSSRGDRKG